MKKVIFRSMLIIRAALLVVLTLAVMLLVASCNEESKKVTVCKDGKIVWLEDGAADYYNEDGDIVSMVSVEGGSYISLRGGSDAVIPAGRETIMVVDVTYRLESQRPQGKNVLYTYSGGYYLVERLGSRQVLEFGRYNIQKFWAVCQDG